MPMRHVRETDTASNEELLIAYGRGDAIAARVLSERIVPRFLALATRLMAGDRAEAEDVVQDAMLKLWRIAPDWELGRAQVTTWLYRVVVNLCTDRHRRVRMQPLEAVAEPEDDTADVIAKMSEVQRLEALDQALRTLPERQRQAVVLRHIEGLSNPSIADIMGTGVDAVESLTARGKRALKARLADRQKELGYGNE